MSALDTPLQLFFGFSILLFLYLGSSLQTFRAAKASPYSVSLFILSVHITIFLFLSKWDIRGFFFYLDKTKAEDNGKAATPIGSWSVYNQQAFLLFAPNDLLGRYLVGWTDRRTDGQVGAWETLADRCGIRRWGRRFHPLFYCVE